MKKLTKYLILAISISVKSCLRICHITKSGHLLYYHYSLNKKRSKWFLQIVSLWYVYERYCYWGK